jgi:uncharacterized protein YgiM (DUF1202 family)
MALVITAYEAPVRYRDNPLTITRGQELKILKRNDEEYPGWVLCENEQGIQGWVPENMLKIVQNRAVAQNQYDARELSLMEGEIVRIEQLESGWAWVTSMTDQTGWIPVKNLKVIE